jgi:hypothetical protein
MGTQSVTAVVNQAGKGRRSRPSKNRRLSKSRRTSKVLSPLLERASESRPAGELQQSDNLMSETINLASAFGSPADSSPSSEQSSTIHLSDDFETRAAAFAKTIGGDAETVSDAGGSGELAGSDQSSEVNPSFELPALSPETIGKFLAVPFEFVADRYGEHWKLTDEERGRLESPAFAWWCKLRGSLGARFAALIEGYAENNAEMFLFVIALVMVCAPKGMKTWKDQQQKKQAGVSIGGSMPESPAASVTTGNPAAERLTL